MAKEPKNPNAVVCGSLHVVESCQVIQNEFERIRFGISKNLQTRQSFHGNFKDVSYLFGRVYYATFSFYRDISSESLLGNFRYLSH